MFEQYQLPYDYDALEPVIDALTMETHHGKHHATYTKVFNEAAAEAGVADKTAEEIFANLDAIEDEALRAKVRNNGGGYYNHNLYFSIMIPGGTKPTPGFLSKICDTFGNLEKLQEELTALAVGQFGSGWAWLSTDKAGNLSVSKTPNQDNPIMEGTGLMPILAIDVWEHAYYLKYKNLRPDYVKAFFDVIDWEAVEAKYNEYIDK